jgi:hypothetical protein
MKENAADLMLQGIIIPLGCAAKIHIPCRDRDRDHGRDRDHDRDRNEGLKSQCRIILCRIYAVAKRSRSRTTET